MPAVSRVGVDSAGGLITSALAPKVLVNGSPIAVKGAAITGHGSGSHAAALINQGSGSVFAQGKAVCRAGDAATCGHKATASATVNAG